MKTMSKEQKVILAWRLGLQFDAPDNSPLQTPHLDERAVRQMVDDINAILSRSPGQPQLLFDQDFNPMEDICVTYT